MTTTQMVVGSQAIFPTIVTKGLQLNLDGTNPASYPGSGTTWFDISGNGRNATLVNAPVYQNANTSVGLGSFNFNGTSQYANVTSDLSGTFTTGGYWTAEMWFKNTNTAGCPLSVIYSAANFTMMEVGFSGPAYIARYFLRATTGGGVAQGALGTETTPVNGWNQYVISYLGNPNFTTRGYQGPNPPTTLGVPTNTTNPGQVASFSGAVFPQLARNAVSTSGMAGAGNFFAGNIGILRVYNRALSQTEIRQNYNATRAYYGL